MSTTYMKADDHQATDSELVPPSEPRPVRTVVVRGEVVEINGRSLEELNTDPDANEPLRMVVPRVVAEGQLTMLAGREKLGKSTLTSFLATVVSCGGELWGEPVESGTVLLVGLEEDPREARRRFNDMGANPKNIVIVDRLLSDDSLLQLEAEFIAHKPRFVIIDSLAAFFHDVEDENGASAWTKKLRPVVELARNSRAGIVLLHHANKHQGAYRGSTAIGAAVDMILEMGETSDDPTVRIMKARGRWAQDTYAVRFDRERLSFGLAFDSAGMREGDGRAKDAAVQHRILEWLAAHPNSGKAKIRDGVGGKGTVCDAAVDALTTAGKITHLGKNAGYIVAPISATPESQAALFEAA